MSLDNYDPPSPDPCCYRATILPVFSRPTPGPRPKRTIPDPYINVWSVFHRPSNLDNSPTITELLYEKSLFPRGSPLPSIEGMTDEQLDIVSHGLALHVLLAEQFMWNFFENNVCHKEHLYFLRKKFFKIFATFALHIYDLEDFVRVGEFSMIKKNVLDFCHDIGVKYASDNLVEVVSGVMAEISTGKMKIKKKYPFLWQLDVDFILGSYQGKFYSFNKFLEEKSDRSHISVKKQVVTFYDKFIRAFEGIKLHKHYVATALEAIRAHKPLQQEEKLDLMLNALNTRHVIRQALFLEAWRGFKEDDLESLYLEDVGPNFDEMFIVSFHNTLNNLAYRRAGLTSLLEEVFRSPTETCTLGNFNKEVVEAVRIANFERMRLGYRFLTTSHLLCGLSRSRVGEKIKVFEKTWIPTPELRYFRETNLLYCILKLSCDVATRLGLEEVLLEHLYIATKFGTRLLPTKKIRTADYSEELIDWNSVLEQGTIVDFLKESTAEEPERRQLCGKISMEALWGHFFQKDCIMPLTPKAMLVTLAREFREKNFKPLERRLLSSTQEPNITATDTMDVDEIESAYYCHLYSQFLFTLYAEDN